MLLVRDLAGYLHLIGVARMPIGKTWTEEDDISLAKAVLDGECLVSYAEEIGRSPNAVYCRLQYLKKNGVLLAGKASKAKKDRLSRLNLLIEQMEVGRKQSGRSA